VRFSTVVGSRGSADTARDVRGFATKFYTRQGNFDLVGNNMPVFFIQDGLKFPDLVHAVKPEPHTEMPQGASAHDTVLGLRVARARDDAHGHVGHVGPRAAAQLQHDGGLRRAHVSAGQRRRPRGAVQVHWKPVLGAYSLLWDEAQKIAGRTATSTAATLWEAIECGAFPEYELGPADRRGEGRAGLRLRSARSDQAACPRSSRRCGASAS
jgi:catalase